MPEEGFEPALSRRNKAFKGVSRGETSRAGAPGRLAKAATVVNVGSAHDRLIAAYLARNQKARREGFARAVWAAIKRKADYGDEEYLLRRVLPDAFIVDRKTESVIAVEAETSSPITVPKILSYNAIWWMLDSVGDGWSFDVHAIDRSGVVTELNMRAFAISGLADRPVGIPSPRPGRTIWPLEQPVFPGEFGATCAAITRAGEALP